jgi:hypothetical protein
VCVCVCVCIMHCVHMAAVLNHNQPRQHRDSLSLHGFLSSCVESTIHVLTLAFLCRPLLALGASGMRCVAAKILPGFSPSPARMHEKRPLAEEECLSEAQILKSTHSRSLLTL